MNSHDRKQFIDLSLEEEWVKARDGAAHVCEAITRDMVARGLGHQPELIAAHRKEWLRFAQRVLDARLATEQQLLASEGRNAPSDWPSRLQEDLRELRLRLEKELIACVQCDIHETSQRDIGPQLLFGVRAQIEALHAAAVQRIAMMRLQHQLRAEAEVEKVSAAMTNVTLNIKNSTVGTVNLAPVMGDINTHLSILKANGHDQFADTLKRLAEAIGNAAALGDHRKDALEQVQAISAEAERPADKRNLGMVKAIAFALGTTLGSVADLKTVWDMAWPPIKAYFGLP